MDKTQRTFTFQRLAMCGQKPDLRTLTPRSRNSTHWGCRRKDYREFSARPTRYRSAPSLGFAGSKSHHRRCANCPRELWLKIWTSYGGRFDKGTWPAAANTVSTPGSRWFSRNNCRTLAIPNKFPHAFAQFITLAVARWLNLFIKGSWALINCYGGRSLCAPWATSRRSKCRDIRPEQLIVRATLGFAGRTVAMQGRFV